MEAFTKHTGLVVPLDRANVDTDAIMPKQFLKSIRRTGFGDYVFDEWRYLDKGFPGMDCSKRLRNPDFSFNQARFKGASILLTQDNFGCGSSREHAPWGLAEFGIRCILAPSFAEIFYGNCIKNGILPVTLDKASINQLFAWVNDTPGFELTVDLDAQSITLPNQECWSFSVETNVKHRLLNGLDDIELTLTHADEIKSFEQARQKQAPWLFQRIVIDG